MNQSLMVDACLSQEEVKNVYNSLAWIYDIWGALTERKARQRGIELARIQNGEGVLDVACGTGLILADIVKINRDGVNVGIDISTGMLQKARARLKESRVELKQASAFAIPYPEATFDLITNGYMFDLMPIEAIPAILAEFRRVLKPAGRLLLVDMTIGEGAGSRIYQRIYQKSPALLGGCRGVKMTGFLAQAGFQVITREYHQQFFFPSEVILAKASSPIHNFEKSGYSDTVVLTA